MKYQRENLQLAEGLRCARLSVEQCQKIHDATLEVMEQVGAVVQPGGPGYHGQSRCPYHRR